ncbi:MAG: hypothetical protein RI953_1748 [Pseudomonadota bacterium]
MTQEVIRNDERYKIEARIGSGAMATVYRAYDQRLNRIVALKILHEHLATNAELRLRFEQEARLAARIDHPNVVRIYDFGLNSQNQIFMVSEFVDGRSLTLAMRRYMSQSNPYLSPVLAALVAHEIARGIEAAHRHSVIHRDLKPDNVLVSHQGEVKLTDFGVARPFDSSMTQVGQFIGSLTYASPEQIQGEKVDARSDIFSFGVILFELLTGQLPFRSTNPTDLAIKITQAKVPPLNQVRASVPFELDSIVRKCLRANPTERPAAAELLVRDLALYLGKNEIQISSRMIQDGFENPNLFSSTIRRSPLSASVPSDTDQALPVEVKQNPPEPKEQERPNPLPIVAGKIPQPAVSPTEGIPATPKMQPQVSPRVAGRAKPIKDKESWFPLGLIAALLIVAGVLVARQFPETQSWLEQWRHYLSQSRKGATEELSKDSVRPSEPNETFSQAPVIQPTFSPRPTDTSIPQSPQIQTTRRPVPETTIANKSGQSGSNTSTPAKKSNAQSPTKTKTPQPQAKPTREPTKIKPTNVTATKLPTGKTVPENINNTAAGRKSQLQIQTNPGPRTIEIYRGNRKEFLGLSGRTNFPRTFSAVEPGLVVLHIPVEEVDGRKYEGFQIKIKLEPGKQFTLPAVNSRALVNVSLRCPQDVIVSKVNGKRILHRGGPLTIEAAQGGTAEIETLSKSGVKDAFKLEIRSDGQTLSCGNNANKDR